MLWPRPRACRCCCHHHEGHLWCLPGRDHYSARRLGMYLPLATSLILTDTISGRRNCSIHDRHPPRLCHPRSTYCCVKPPQADKEAVLCRHLRPLPLYQPQERKASPMISDETYECIMRHAEELNSAIVYDRDFNYQYFGFKTLERSYLLRKMARLPNAHNT